MGAHKEPDLTVELSGIVLKNPFLVCSGTFGNGREYSEWMDIEGLGGIMTKAVTLEPCAGNTPPRLWEVPGGLLNSIGLENKGAKAFLRDDLPWLHDLDVAVWVNVAGFCDDDYVRTASLISESGLADALELNVSCPNIKGGGLQYSSSPERAGRLTRAVKQVAELPLYVKLSACGADIKEVAAAVEEAGADGISLINTLPAMAIDVETARPRLGHITGGLSGPAVHSVAVAAVWEASQAVDIPVIGMGGIWSSSDAIELMMAGAQAVAVGTLNFRNPSAVLEMIDDLKSFMSRRGFGSVSEMVGLTRREVMRES